MTFLLDTNVLLRLHDTDSAFHDECVRAVERLRRRPDRVKVCAQVLIEFWVVSTRPLDVNGLGIPATKAARHIADYCRTFRCVPEPRDMAYRWREIAERYNVQGRQAHDARLVALMKAHSISHIVTLNVADFRRYDEITVISPSDVLKL